MPAWLNDFDAMQRMAAEYLAYFDKNGPDAAVCGMAGPDFTMCEFLAGRIIYNSNVEYDPGEVIELPNTLNKNDGQQGEIRARVLRPTDTPAGFAHFLRRRFSYEVLVD